MTRRTAIVVVPAAIALIGAAFGAWTTRGLPPFWRLDRLHADPPAAPVAGLPVGTLVADVRAADPVAPPFALRADATAAGGTSLTLPEGAGTTNAQGRAALDVDAPAAGVYRVWARCRWNDACGNSVALAIDGGHARTIGQDAVFNDWHWVSAGAHELRQGTNDVVVLEREDGVSLDQLLFTPDPEFEPTGPVLAQGLAPGLRRFADQFDRSPGHGLEEWEIRSGKWEIAFTLDPNRMPLQYSLDGRPDEVAAPATEAVILARAAPLAGTRMAFSVFTRDAATCGALLASVAPAASPAHPATAADERFSFEVADAGSRLRLAAGGAERTVDLGRALRPNQWHRIEIERWAWVARVRVDGQPVLCALDLPPAPARAGLAVVRGAAVFDDVEIEEIPWAAEDGAARRMAWEVDPGARWFRQREQGALIGLRGAIVPRPGPWPMRELMLDAGADADHCRLVAGGSCVAAVDGAARLVELASVESVAAAAPPRVRIEAADVPARVERLAVRYGPARASDDFVIGPFTFAQSFVVDPSDYVDFTDAEFKAMQESPERDKLMRQVRQYALVGPSADRALWLTRGGEWSIHDGLLVGRGPEAALLYCIEIASPLDVRLRLRLPDPTARAALQLYAAPDAGHRIAFSAGAAGADAAAPAGETRVALPGDAEWHDVLVRARGGGLSVDVDGHAAARAALAPGDGGDLRLEATAGEVEFDDVEIRVPRRTDEGAFYGFDRRETDWWRAGGEWVDHAGFECAIGSQWVSLIAPEGEGYLWNKQPFGPDVLAAYTVEENSEWFGWHQHPSHQHHPYDNIVLALAVTEDAHSGYRLEVNSRGHTATVLYRADQEVASVAQDDAFPIHYVGGHAPYSPRRNRVMLSKRGGLLRASINGREILRWTDPAPLPVQRVALGGYQTRANFGHIEIRALSSAAPLPVAAPAVAASR